MIWRPILFSGPMVRAILLGKKSKTRRIATIDKSTTNIFYVKNEDTVPNGIYTGWVKQCGAPLCIPIKCPYGQGGDGLWVRETFRFKQGYGEFDFGINYLADDNPDIVHGWIDNESRVDQPVNERKRPSIFMPRWASRISLLIKGIQVERLQNITETDAIDEGALNRKEFEFIWGNINGRESWASNPWVWVIEFDRTQA